MEIHLLNTSHGLIPMYNEDYDDKKKLKIGTTYKAKITVPRNYQFHKKYFALINCAWEYQNEGVQNHFHGSVEAFRKTVEVSAGWFEPLYSIKLNEWVESPKSISFDKMSESEFSDLYGKVKDVLFMVFLKNISEEEFTRNLITF